MKSKTSANDPAVLTSWKEIAQYLGKGVRTVQRWEQELGLPVRRPMAPTAKRAVLARRSDLDAWVAVHWSCQAKDTPASLEGFSRVIIVDLNERIRTSAALRNTNRALLKELSAAVDSLHQELLAMSRIN